MLKYFHLRVAFLATSMLFIAETAYSNSPTVGGEYPMIADSNIDNLVCYMQTADGRILNLSSLCRKQPEIVVSAIRHNGDYVVIYAANKTEKIVKFIKINYEVVGQDSSVIQRNATFTTQQTLSPGQTGTFLAFVPGDRNVRVTSVEWN